MSEKTSNNHNSIVKAIHGVLVEIKGLGVLIIGKSGVGKSECALDLISRGSKLISDDVVKIKLLDSGKLVGSAPETTKHLMEIRGIGIINIRDLYGNQSVIDERDVDLVVELIPWDEDTEYERLGVDQKYYNILGLELCYLLIPTSPGKNISSILEAAALNHIHKLSSANSIIENMSKVKNKNMATGTK